MNRFKRWMLCGLSAATLAIALLQAGSLRSAGANAPRPSLPPPIATLV